MGYSSQESLVKELNIVQNQIKIGDIYYHYKDKSLEYRIDSIVILEESEEVAIIYKALYSNNIKSVRTFKIFNETIEVNGISTKRFIKV